MSTKDETLGQMKQRHKLELRNLQNDIKAFQKKAKKDRMSKKDMETQVKAMEEDTQNRHEEEMTRFKETEDGEEEDRESKTVAEEATAPEISKAPQPTKAQRRRENKKKQEKERRERIEEANKNTVSERQIEADIIAAKLTQYGLAIKDIPSDGHCMYHAVADQMKRHQMAHNSDEPAFKFLRRITGNYMRARPDDFLPFLALDNESGKTSSELFQEYCDRVINTSDWGGQLELRALACAIQRPIHVFAADSDVITMGEEFSEKEPLQLTYHLHYYTLGEHFNSVMPM